MAKKKGTGGANWMDTYGDMVTLLLCFFVLLYSMSTISEDKWKALVQSFNPNAIPSTTEIEGNEGGPLSDPTNTNLYDPSEDMSLEEQQAEIERALEELYKALMDYAEESEMNEQIEITKGDGYVFVCFDDAVFFEPNEYELLEGGAEVLMAISQIMSQAKDYIDEVRVMGHTAQASMSRPNYTLEDRLLSSERAAVAAAYIQEYSEIDAARIISDGFGQWRPIASNETEDGRSRNRRVEIKISGLDVMDQMGDSLEQYELLRGDSADISIEENTTADQADAELTGDGETALE